MEYTNLLSFRTKFKKDHNSNLSFLRRLLLLQYVGRRLTKIHAFFGWSYTVLEHKYKDNILYSRFEVVGLNFIF